MARLCDESVMKLFASCLSMRGRRNYLIVQGVSNTRVFFDRDAIKRKEEEIRGLISDLPETFKATNGGNSLGRIGEYKNQEGVWTKDLGVMEKVALLGVAIEAVRVTKSGIRYISAGLF